jgi:hypothetical protein
MEYPEHEGKPLTQETAIEAMDYIQEEVFLPDSYLGALERSRKTRVWGIKNLDAETEEKKERSG